MASDHICPSCGADWGKGQQRMVNTDWPCLSCADAIERSLSAYFGPGVNEESVADLAVARGLCKPGWAAGSNVVDFACEWIRRQRAHDERLAAGMVEKAEELLVLGAALTEGNVHFRRMAEDLREKLAACRAGKEAE